MQYDDFVRSVAERAGIESPPEAERTVLGVLQALCDRISRKEGYDLLAQLPARLKRRIKPTVARIPMAPADFVDRVARELEIPAEEARERVRAVFATLRQAVTWGELEDVVLELEPGYADLLA